MISRFNGISSWVTGVIIEPEDIKNRVKVFKKVVNIGKHLLELNSLNALMALIAGWNNSAILRLKYLFINIFIFYCIEYYSYFVTYSLTEILSTPKKNSLERPKRI